eukprot:Sspe_Gene.64412::Locus_38055_Transcript_1_1_Confidence_1.000_Length_2087::g.64412::m.64412
MAQPRRKDGKRSKDNTEIWKCKHEEQVDELAQALLREYLHKKGFQETMRIFDTEQPRTDRTISSRTLMADMMVLEKCHKRNQARESPLGSIMEMLCDARLARKEQAEKGKAGENGTDHGEDSDNSDSFEEWRGKRWAKLRARREAAERIINQPPEAEKQGKSSKASKGEKKNKGEKKGDKKKKALQNGQKGHSKEKRLSIDDVLPGGDSSSDQQDDDASLDHSDSQPTLPVTPRLQPKACWGGDEEELKDESLSLAGSASFRKDNALLGDDTNDALGMGGPSSFPIKEFHGRPIGSQMAQKLKELFVGDKGQFPESWLRQGFRFSDDVPYGIIQNNGGPCGALAAVQARILKVLFLEGRVVDGTCVPRPTQQAALLDAIADLLVDVARGSSLSIVLPADADTDHSISPKKVRYDPELETWRVHNVGRERSEARGLLQQHLGYFTSPTSTAMFSVILSAIFTRGGVSAVQGDIDEFAGSTGRLVCRYDYTSQELVSLLLYGRAHSNVFDGTKVFQEGSSKVVLRGVPYRSSYGLLTYQEHTQDTEVGPHLKDPLFPIWLVWNESHYSVLFSKSKVLGSDKVELYYYDQLGCQDEEYHLTVDVKGGKSGKAPTQDNPFLDDIIRTRAEWKNAVVDWNGSEPLL